MRQTLRLIALVLLLATSFGAKIQIFNVFPEVLFVYQAPVDLLQSYVSASWFIAHGFLRSSSDGLVLSVLGASALYGAAFLLIVFVTGIGRK